MTSDNRHATGAALTGAGATTAAAGLVAGGIPGVRADSTAMENLKSRKSLKRIGAEASLARGGIFGFRTDAHRRYEQDLRNDLAYHEKKNPNPSRKDTFARYKEAGKIGPEKEIVRHMKRGRIGGNLALLGGVAATAAGVKQMRDARAADRVAKEASDVDRYNGMIAGGAATTAVGTGVGGRVLASQGAKWKAREKRALATAQMHVPKMTPDLYDDDVVRNANTVLAGKSKKATQAAARARGEAAQHRYFANVYNKTARGLKRATLPAAAVSLMAAGGYAANKRTREESAVGKSLVDLAQIAKSEKWGAKDAAALGAAAAGTGVAVDQGLKASRNIGNARYLSGPSHTRDVMGDKWTNEARSWNRTKALKRIGIAGLGLAGGITAGQLYSERRDRRQAAKKAAVAKAQTRNVLRVLDRNPGLLRETTREGDYAREAMKRAGASVGGKRRGFGYGSVMGVPRGKPGPDVPTSFSRRPKSERQPL